MAEKEKQGGRRHKESSNSDSENQDDSFLARVQNVGSWKKWEWYQTGSNLYLLLSHFIFQCHCGEIEFSILFSKPYDCPPPPPPVLLTTSPNESLLWMKQWFHRGHRGVNNLSNPTMGKQFIQHTLVGWPSGLERHPMHWKAICSVPSQSTYGR